MHLHDTLHTGISRIEVTSMDIKKQLGLRIQAVRKATGYSQEKFAISIDMDRTYFSSVESGRRNISIVNIKKIADGLGVSLGELFQGL